MNAPLPRLLAIVGLALTTTAVLAAEVTVQAGETLPRIAQRTLGDPSAATELRALNDLKSDEVAPGTVLQLPGNDRALAVSAISAARNAVKQAGADSPRREDASKQLAEAEALLKQAQYRQAATAADEAWKLVSSAGGEKTRFTVEVSKDGKTTQVRTTTGQPVRVEAQGKVQHVAAGEAVAVAKGEAPRKLASVTPNKVEAQPPVVPAGPRLEAPVPLAPAANGQLRLQPQKNGALGPVNLSWKAVSGATAYEVELLRPRARPLVMKVERPAARFSSLPAGTYSWTVRAVTAGGRSEPSERRSFELAADTLKLEVKGTQWK